MRVHRHRKGRKLKLIAIDANENMVRHLNGLGFVSGVEFEIVSDCNPYIVVLRGSRLAISGELMKCLRVL
jgi:Fe2+ transport system protein FeoA